jgi:hypothetical protein
MRRITEFLEAIKKWFEEGQIGLDERSHDLVEDLTLLTDLVNEINYDVLLLKQLIANARSQQSISTASASNGPMT